MHPEGDQYKRKKLVTATSIKYLCAVVSDYGLKLTVGQTGQGPTALAVGARRVCLDIFLSSIFTHFFLPLYETVRYRLKYCFKWPLNPKQPTLCLKLEVLSRIAQATAALRKLKLIWRDNTHFLWDQW